MARPPRPYSSSPRVTGAGAARPSELGNVIATTHDGRDITWPWVGELQEFRDRRLLGAIDWGAYDRVLLDDQVKSCLEQRRTAVVSKPWDVLPGDVDDPRAVAAADGLKKNLGNLGWDRVTDKMLYAPFYGVAVAELVWGVKDGLFQWTAIKVRHGRRFRKDKEDRLRLLTPANMAGEVLPEKKFWSMTAGGSDDDQPYGRGLAEWLYWPTLFKRNGIRFWNMFLDKFSVPTAKGTYRPGTPKEDIEKLLAALAAIANDTGFVVPEGMAVELLHVAQAGIDFKQMPSYMDDAISRIILSQTMTSTAHSSGMGSGQAQVHAGVKHEIIKADADLQSDSFTEGPSRWWTDFNFGTDVAAPIVVRAVEEEEDTKKEAETDEVLARVGWRRTEESFRDTYGDGYERAAPLAAAAPAGSAAAAGADGADRPLDPAAEARGGSNVVPFGKAVSFAEPMSLYVHRKLLNASALVAWAKAQGFKATVPAEEMHVTLTYSRQAVDWFAMGQASAQSGDGSLKVPAGGPRQVEALGDKGAVVLVFASDDLKWRHDDMREKGASFDFQEYRPHVTITYDGAGVDLAKVEAYQGELVFGPEVFEQVDDGWSDSLNEASFAEPAAAAGDIVDQAVAAAIAADGWRPYVEPIVNPLLEELKLAQSPEEVMSILARAAELDDESALTEALARGGFAVRMAATAGEDAAA